MAVRAARTESTRVVENGEARRLRHDVMLRLVLLVRLLLLTLLITILSLLALVRPRLLVRILRRLLL